MVQSWYVAAGIALRDAAATDSGGAGHSPPSDDSLPREVSGASRVVAAVARWSRQVFVKTWKEDEDFDAIANKCRALV